jgi:deferrochelatase/peroxidase EfeB
VVQRGGGEPAQAVGIGPRDEAPQPAGLEAAGDTAAAPPRSGLTRRGAISGAALVGANATVAALLGPHAAAAVRPPRRAHPGGAGAAVPFYGPHQAGVVTAAQEYLDFATFDLASDSRADLRRLLETWSSAAATLTAGRQYEPAAQQPSAAPLDGGEALGSGPARLTLTFGLGPGIFRGARAARLGLHGRGPRELRELPPFAGGRLDPASSGGDLCIQACAEDPQVAFHAIHLLARLAAGAARLRFSLQGFGRTSSTSREQRTPRNLMGFKDGTNNLRVQDGEALERFVWVQPGDGPSWMAGGSYLIARRIRILFGRWDATALERQERTVGRVKASGAPLGETREFDHVPLKARDAAGQPVIPADAHIRLASPDENAGQPLLRRGYSYAEGADAATGEPDAGLFFICFQRKPSRQFIPIQRRLARSDALTRFIVHTSSAIFACPPGTLPGGYVGELLLG